MGRWCISNGEFPINQYSTTAIQVPNKFVIRLRFRYIGLVMLGTNLNMSLSTVASDDAAHVAIIHLLCEAVEALED